MHQFLSTILKDIRMLAPRRIEKSSFLCFSGLVKCSAPTFDLHQRPYIKPMQQQPLSILYIHIFLKTLEIRDFERVSDQHHRTQPKHVFEKRQFQLPTAPQNTPTNQQKPKTNSARKSRRPLLARDIKAAVLGIVRFLTIIAHAFSHQAICC